ncbi:MAG: selenocysteine-specific translation elongation factor [Propionibacteriales bacterium]|nr:selenocysteine-specific translation elongation factor [Propionibacteriales bacterium]
MHVVATAGHVDHGKSTLVRALTGMEPDRWAEERRRGVTIGLGFCWAEFDGVGDVAFVDVPGHERFVPTMLAGVGTVPAVLLVVAADEGWKPQSTEHLAALDALGVRHGLLVVTRRDLADPEPALAEATAHLGRTTLGDVPRLAVSATTGEGVDELRAAISRLVGGLPDPDGDAPVRLWVDRAFTIRGAGTVVTGTLPAGTIRRGDRLSVAGQDREVVVRGVQSLGRSVDQVGGVARVALNLRGVEPPQVPRGCALVTPGRWTTTGVLDVRLAAGRSEDLPRQVIVHAGSAAVAAHVRPLGPDTVRLSLDEPVPLHVGDRLLLRDPGARQVTGVQVLDPDPPALQRRGSGRRRAEVLATVAGAPDGAAELARRGVVDAGAFAALGVEAPVVPLVGDWLVDPALVASLTSRLAAAVEDHARAHPLDAGLPIERARQLLDLPDRRLVHALAERPDSGVIVKDGRLIRPGASVPPDLLRAVTPLLDRLSADPFAAPDAETLADLRLGPPELAAAARAGLVLRLTDVVVVAPDAAERAVAMLGALPQPFTLSEARKTLGTSRRIAVPLLERMQRDGLTRRVGDGHEVVPRP